MKYLKFFLKLSLFLPIALCAMAFSYKVDPSGLFWGAGFERYARELMLEGNYIDGYERLDGRKLNEVYAKNVPYAPEVLVNGSSRSMLITKDYAGGKTFYNARNVGADMYDLYTSYYIFEKENKTPEIFVIGLDPWVFGEHNDKRSNKELCNEFFGEELGIELGEYEEVNKYDKYLALIDPSYFQAAVKYSKRDKSDDPVPQTVPTDLIYETDTVIKAPDGSIVYDKGFRERNQRYADEEAMAVSNMHFYLIGEVSEIDSEKAKYFETFIEYLQAKGVKIIFYLPPYHPTLYELETVYINESGASNSYEVIETYIRETAEKYGITVYGSYDPNNLGLTNRDFYDGLHVRPESLSKILPVFN